MSKSSHPHLVREDERLSHPLYPVQHWCAHGEPLLPLMWRELLDLVLDQGLQAQVCLQHHPHGGLGNPKLPPECADGHIGVLLNPGGDVLLDGPKDLTYGLARPGGIMGVPTLLIHLPGVPHGGNVDAHASGNGRLALA